MDLRDKILSANQNVKLTPLYVQEWDCTVHLKPMSAGDFMKMVKSVKDGNMPDDYFSRLVYMCACDESGTRIFSESDIPSIQEMDAEPIKRIALMAQSINGLDDTSEALAEKN